MTLQWNHQLLDQVQGEAKREALFAVGEIILQTSNQRVPHEYGTLEQSGAVDVQGETLTVSYGTVYAVPQHERLDYVHTNGRQAKYLETAVTDTKEAQATAVAEIYAKYFGGS